MSTIHYPKVVTYEVCIHPEGAPFPNAGFFEATFKKRFPSASMSILDTAMQPGKVSLVLFAAVCRGAGASFTVTDL